MKLVSKIFDSRVFMVVGSLLFAASIVYEAVNYPWLTVNSSSLTGIQMRDPSAPDFDYIEYKDLKNVLSPDLKKMHIEPSDENTLILPGGGSGVMAKDLWTALISRASGTADPSGVPSASAASGISAASDAITASGTSGASTASGASASSGASTASDTSSALGGSDTAGTPAVPDIAATVGGDVLSKPILLGNVKIPRINISENLFEGTTTQIKFGIGHSVRTAMPGETGNSVIAAHRTSLSGKAPFRYLDKLQNGDEVLVTFDGMTFTYEVFDVFMVEKENVWVMWPVAGESHVLTMITCDPVVSVTNHYKRLIVRARLVDGMSNGAPHEPPPD